MLERELAMQRTTDVQVHAHTCVCVLMLIYLSLHFVVANSFVQLVHHIFSLQKSKRNTYHPQ